METKNMKILMPEDYKDWEKLIIHCEMLDGLTELEKEKAKQAFRLLNKEFGKGFLNYAFTNYHPIVQCIVNSAPWTRKWIIQFAESIEALKAQENYSSLLKRLKDKEKFEEGLSVLEVAYKLSKAGFDISIDPSVNVLGSMKIPDLRLFDKNTNEELYVEVSISGKSEIQQDASQTTARITELLWGAGSFIHYSYRIHKTFSERYLDNIVKKITETIEKAKTQGIFQELVIKDIIEIGIAPENDKQVLETWAARRGLKVGEITGTPFQVDEILRTKRKIKNEQEQLPHAHPNILIVWTNNMFFHAYDIGIVINELEKMVYEYPHLLAVVIAEQHIGLSERVITMKDRHMFIKKPKANLLVEQFIILFNQFCEKKVSQAMITKIYNSFGSY